MKKFLVLILVFAMVLLCSCCSAKKEESVSTQDILGKTYVYEKDGAGGAFTITVEEDGTFTYYAGFLSSYIGHGAWTLEGDRLTLKDVSYDIVNHFEVKKDRLVYLSEGSSGFMYVDVSDGDVFNLTDKKGTVFIDDIESDIGER
ncbi:MAG: hypothetical protein IKJ91_10735 [Clostridia bacterium]|nr:hypothetical protein [Clostridia bacterium]